MCTFLSLMSRALFPGLLEEVRAAHEGLERAREGGSEAEMRRYLLELQRCMLRFRETGNEKLEVTSELLDTVSSDTGTSTSEWYYVTSDLLCF